MRLDGRFRGSLGFHRLSNGRLETVLPPILAAAASRSRPEPAKVSELPLAPVLCGAGEKSRLEVVEVPRIAAMLEKGLLRRGLLHVPPPPPPVANNVIALPRFARNSSEWRVDRPTPGAPPDAQA